MQNKIQNSFINTSFQTNTVLRIYQSGADTEIHTDASKEALAGVLMQRAVDDGMYHLCYYYSRLTNQVEQNYHSFELETLAVVKSLKKFRCYLLGQKFRVVTDCFAFNQSMANKIPNARVSRWMVVLAEFEFEVKHRSAERMQHVNALSRASVMSVSTAICERMRKEQ